MTTSTRIVSATALVVVIVALYLWFTSTGDESPTIRVRNGGSIDVTTSLGSFVEEDVEDEVDVDETITGSKKKGWRPDLGTAPSGLQTFDVSLAGDYKCTGDRFQGKKVTITTAGTSVTRTLEVSLRKNGKPDRHPYVLPDSNSSVTVTGAAMRVDDGSDIALTEVAIRGGATCTFTTTGVQNYVEVTPIK